MSDLLVTPSDVLTHLTSTDASVATLSTAFAHCPKLTGDQASGWTNFQSEYVAFSQSRRKRWGSAALNTLLILGAAGTAELDLRADDAKILDYEHQIAGWQAIAKSACGLDVPGLTPRDDPNKPQDATLKTLEHIAVAGACIVGGVALLVGASYVRKLFP